MKLSGKSYCLHLLAKGMIYFRSVQEDGEKEYQIKEEF
jgi:hypothetical protein